MPEFPFDALRRYPDVEADNLYAVDASDRLILDEAADDLASAGTGEVVVIGDHYGALTLGAIALHGATDVRVHQDPLSGELALAHNATATGLDGSHTNHDLDESLLTGARVVLMQLPRSLAALDDISAAIARYAAPDVTVVAGGRQKHMSVAMNEVLGRHFTDVRATLGRQKSRVIVSRIPHPADAGSARREYHRDLGLWVCAYGAAFAGTKVDIGTRYLLGFLPQMKPDAVTAVDLGCGTGILATALARARPGLAILATDESAAAVASARATADANDVAITVLRDDGLSAQPAACADLVLLNPPFHIGSAVEPGIALKLFDEAARVLKPGGELWTVFNSHLSYRAALTRSVGPTRQVGRNAKFTVTASTR
ncbi:class I SAM-dependent methyltransferase [Planctomonas psychrotolerans]|uniref:class I SAM-dependent methyltransferase n=1 Tax=Planctomonas psychrotolerans TaxID=2528712 RepID=UPI0012395B0E|nr:methyltransferase [Planctomonas psychrotolerans]